MIIGNKLLCKKDYPEYELYKNRVYEVEKDHPLISDNDPDLLEYFYNINETKNILRTKLIDKMIDNDSE